MSLHAKGLLLVRFFAHSAKHFRREFRARAVVAPIFELQPLEKRLFLTASPTISVTTSNPLEGQQVDVALASNDNDDEGIDHWAIDWGDGNTDTISGDPSSAGHTYLDSGHYNINASVTENGTGGGTGGNTGGDTGGTGGTGGGSSGDTFTTATYVVVGPSPVVAVTSNSGLSAVPAGSPYFINVATSHDSADTDSDPIQTIQVNWGDGHSDTYNGSSYGGTMPNPLIVSHTYSAVSTPTITATATDDDDMSGSGSMNLTVHAPPVPWISGNYQVKAASTYTLNLANNSSDLTHSPIDSWQIVWGDGSPVQTVTGNPSTLTHVFSSPTPADLIRATAYQDAVGFQSNALGVAVTIATPTDPPSTNVVVNFQQAYDGIDSSRHYVAGNVPDVGLMFSDRSDFYLYGTDYAYGWDSSGVQAKTSGSNATHGRDQSAGRHCLQDRAC